MTTTSTPPLTRTWLPAAAAACTLFLWASAFVAIRHLGETVTPGALTLGRLTVAAIVLGILVLRRTPTWPARRDWPLLLACGVMWFGVYNLALNEAERRIDAGTAAMLIQIGPLLIALLAAMFLGEQLTPWVLIGIAVAFCGVAVISLANGESGTGDVWGVILTVLAAITYAVGVVAQKPLTARIPPFELIFLSCLIGIVTALPFAGGLADLAHQPLATWGWIVYLGVFPTALAFSTWAYALKRMGAARLSITTFLVPVIAIALAWVLLDEAPAPLAYVGGALCVAGVLISRRRTASARRTPASP
ncbi:DMT family transporter [Nocardioides sp.]|uniref:DMT family transporter n=1 Tax=Nocardioides sp. TaxID=35761 RepID=UPI003D14C8DE